MEVFYKYRGNLLTGNICIKEYFDLKRYDGRTNEFRVFYCKRIIHQSRRRNSLIDTRISEAPITPLIMRNYLTDHGRLLRQEMEACRGCLRDRMRRHIIGHCIGRWMQERIITSVYDEAVQKHGTPYRL